jgi:hypothetical protein
MLEFASPFLLRSELVLCRKESNMLEMLQHTLRLKTFQSINNMRFEIGADGYILLEMNEFQS